MFNRMLDRLALVTERHPRKVALLLVIMLTLLMLVFAATCAPKANAVGQTDGVVYIYAAAAEAEELEREDLTEIAALSHIADCEGGCVKPGGLLPVLYKVRPALPPSDRHETHGEVVVRRIVENEGYIFAGTFTVALYPDFVFAVGTGRVFASVDFETRSPAVVRWTDEYGAPQSVACRSIGNCELPEIHVGAVVSVTRTGTGSYNAECYDEDSSACSGHAVNFVRFVVDSEAEIGVSWRQVSR